MSCWLFHGPGAKDAALSAASKAGFLLCDPVGEEGLKVDEARGIASLLLESTFSEAKGVVVVGPMDLASNKASDALLKSIEQFNAYVQPILWANDLGGVSPTIQSRCLTFWSPALVDEEVDEQFSDIARELVFGALDGNLETVLRVLNQVNNLKVPDREHRFFKEVSEALTGYLDNPKAYALWSSLRKTLILNKITFLDVVSGFLNGLETSTRGEG